ncbi:MAG: thiosulfate oxidation carrier complex protein SoxZ [Deltaproteobacteria bacterium]|nr:thiosulfate oxidation carrier complex protein SoxZ [Deltaproteobacteria bacterium]
MAEIGQVKIRLPSTIQQGDVVRVRSLVLHPMEVVQRDKAGRVVMKNYNFIHTMIVTFNGKEILRGETTQSISENPIFTFPLKVTQPGKLTVVFLDTAGKKYEGTAEVKL